jgi:hypothetical protein
MKNYSVLFLLFCATGITHNVSGMKEQKEQVVWLKTGSEIPLAVLRQYCPLIKKCCDTNDVENGKSPAGAILLDAAYVNDTVNIEENSGPKYEAIQLLQKTGLIYQPSKKFPRRFSLVSKDNVDLRRLIVTCLVKNDRGGVSYGDPQEPCSHIVVLITKKLIHVNHYDTFIKLLQKHCDGETTKTERDRTRKILSDLAIFGSKKYTRKSEDYKVLHKLLQDGLVIKTLEDGPSYKLNPYAEPLVEASLHVNKKNEIYFGDPVKPTYKKILETSRKSLE